MARPPHVPHAETELEEFFELSIDPLSIIGFDGAFKRVNASFVRLLGHSKPELFARSALDILHPDDVEPVREALAHLAEGHDVVRFEGRVVCADGAVRWLEWSTRTMPERGVVYCVGRDTTDRRRVEGELREARRLLEARRDELSVLAEEQAARRRVVTLVARDVPSNELCGAVVREAGARLGAEPRAEVDRLADEQAALRRVATRVAQGMAADELFSAVCDEVEALVGADVSVVVRFQADGTATLMGTNASRHPVGARLEMDPEFVVAAVHRTARAARFDTDDPAAPGMLEVVRAERVRSALAAPIVVEGRLWGAFVVGARDRPLAPGMERRLADFTELVATAISNVQARAEVEHLAAEQAALRRVATLVAEGAQPAAVFDAVAAEMEGLLGADQVSLARYEPDEDVTVVAHRGTGASRLPPGSRLGLQGQSVTATVRRTERPARIEDFERADGPIAAIVRAMGMRVSVGAPIIVDGRLWGAIAACWVRAESPPDDTEERMARFAELLDTAIANADSRDQLAASRARLVTAADEARRRVVRDLHDGAQQRLVHTIVALKLAQRALRRPDGRAESLVAEALGHAEKSNEELRELAHGILPAVLTRDGLHAALGALATRLRLPVELEIAGERVQADVEASAYLMVAEALTNVAKHAHAQRAGVRASLADGALLVEVVDDGVGGADPRGHGLVGMADRVTALGGRLEIDSPPGVGTLVSATFPVRERSTARAADAEHAAPRPDRAIGFPRHDEPERWPAARARLPGDEGRRFLRVSRSSTSTRVSRRSRRNSSRSSDVRRPAQPSSTSS